MPTPRSGRAVSAPGQKATVATSATREEMV